MSSMNAQSNKEQTQNQWMKVSEMQISIKIRKGFLNIKSFTKLDKSRGLHTTFSVKVEMVHILVFVGHIISVLTIEVCH